MASFISPSITSAEKAKALAEKLPHKVGYFSDGEGHFDLWQRYLKISLVLYVDENVPINMDTTGLHWKDAINNITFATQKIILRDGCHFIYGGDSCDRGHGDIRFLKDLISLKERYPERVHFILGNRDVNKLRLPTALHPKILVHKPAAYWVPSNTTELESFPLNDRNEKMKWTLKQTMGAPMSYECRRQELQELGLPFDDDTVTDSYLSLIMPGGLLLKMLQYGKLAVIYEDTIFVHGALNDSCLGWVPPTFGESSSFDLATSLESSQTINNPLEWLQKADRFVTSEVAHFTETIEAYLAAMDTLDINDGAAAAASCWDIDGGIPYKHSQPGSRLLLCGMGVLPDKSVNPSVIYNSYLVNGKYVPTSQRVCEWIAAAGIKNVIVGHQPNGDAPLFANNFYNTADGETKKIVVVLGDSGYSKFVMYPRSNHLLYSDFASTYAGVEVPTEAYDEWISYDAFVKKFHSDQYRPSNMSGAAVSADSRNIHQVHDLNIAFNREVAPRYTAKDSLAEAHFIVHGTVSTSSTFACVVSPDEPFIGNVTPSGWYVKARGLTYPDISNEEYFLLAYSEKFDFKSKIVSHSELKEEFNA